MMRLYRLLLRLCPVSFRHEYGAEMEHILAQKLRSAGSVQSVWIWLGAMTDLLITAAATHFDLLGQDTRLALRRAAKDPRFTATAALVVALGVGAATAVFSVAHHVVLKPLPLQDPDRLVKLWEDQSDRGYNRMEPSAANYADWKAEARSFQSMAAYRGAALSLTGAGDPERIIGAAVTWDMFPTVGVQPYLGRTMTAEEDRAGAAGTVVLHYGFWMRRFAGDPAVVGRTIHMDGQVHTVIGVMPPDFYFPRREVEFWTAMRFEDRDFEDRRNHVLGVVARLKDGVNLEQARAEMRVIASNLERRFPATNEKTGIAVVGLRDDLSRGSRTMLAVLAAAALFVVLIACSNLASLLLARAAARRKEISLRSALGAGRERLVRLLVTESLLLSLAGALLGALLASVFIPLLARLVPSALPISQVPAIDWRIFLLAMILTMATSMLFGVLPALRSAGFSLGTRSAASEHRSRLRRALVVTQVAASIALFVSTGLLARALNRLEQVPPGFTTEGTMALRTMLPFPKYAQTAARERFYNTVLNDIRALPGVRHAAVTSFRPMGDFRGGMWPLVVPGHLQETHANARFVTPGYFSAIGIPLVRGRDVNSSDQPASQRVAVVSESFVEHFWPGEPGLGRTFGITYGDLKFTIVGVVKDVRFRGLESRSSEPQMYFAHQQCPDEAFLWFAPKDIIVSSHGDPLRLMPQIRGIVQRADPQQPISDVQRMADVIIAETATRRTQLWVIGSFTGAAFLLAAIGLHGLLAYAVAQRTQEIGVRRALGAQTGRIAGMVLGEGATLAILGAAAGVTAAYWLGHSMESLLFGVTPADATTLAVSAGAAILLTLIGTLAPMIQAIQIDPATALRSE